MIVDKSERATLFIDYEAKDCNKMSLEEIINDCAEDFKVYMKENIKRSPVCCTFQLTYFSNIDNSLDGNKKHD